MKRPLIPGYLPEWVSGATAKYWWGKAIRSDQQSWGYHSHHNYRIAVDYRAKWSEK
jgi:hypothetical protein